MTRRSSRRLLRAAAASPFLLLSASCLGLMDAAKMARLWKPALDSGRIEWDGGSVAVLRTFYGVDAVDAWWRGLTVLFAPSTLGYDAVGWWVGFELVVHLAALYAVWMLEAHRRASRRGPAGFPTVFIVLGQAVGTGVVAPVFYFLCFVFGPGPGPAPAKPGRHAAGPWETPQAPFMLPLMLLFHVLGAGAAFLAPRPETRHFWTWTWLLSPLGVGLGDAMLTRLLWPPSPSSPPGAERRVPLASPELQLGALAVLSAGTWAYMVVRAPYSLSAIFLPQAAARDDLVLHSRLVLQLDCLTTFGASFLWLLYVCFDLAGAGALEGGDWRSLTGLLPVVLALGGPGTAFIFAWCWKERAVRRWVGER